VEREREWKGKDGGGGEREWRKDRHKKMTERGSRGKGKRERSKTGRMEKRG